MEVATAKELLVALIGKLGKHPQRFLRCDPVCWVEAKHSSDLPRTKKKNLPGEGRTKTHLSGEERANSGEERKRN